MGGSWYLRRALVLPGIALIIRAWWAVTFPLHWVRTCTVSRRVRVVQACFRDVWSMEPAAETLPRWHSRGCWRGNGTSPSPTRTFFRGHGQNYF